MKKYLFYKNKIRLIMLLLFQTVRTVGTVGVALLINLLIDKISLAVSVKNSEPFKGCVIICCVYAVLLGVVIFTSERLKAEVVKHTMTHLRKEAVHGILQKSITDFQTKNSAEYLTLLNQNMGTFEENYLKNLLAIYDSFVSVLIAVLILIYINPIIAVISIAAMAIPSFIPKLFGKKLKAGQGEIMQAAAAYNAGIKDLFQGFEVIKSYGAEKQLEERHAGGAKCLEQSKSGMANTMGWLYGLANMSSVAVQFLIMALAGVFAVKGIITIGSIIAVTQLTGQVISPAFGLSAKISQWKATKPICNQFLAAFMPESESKEISKPKDIEKTMCLQEVSYAYENAPVVSHVNLELEAGKKYAIVGKSGSGKSTLLKLLAGYYPDYEGKILLDERENVQCDTALIHQNVFLFDDTVKNNISLYGEYAEADMEEAVRLAGLEEVIKNLEQGLDTRVEENGVRFSGGEKQRIAVARAILHRKKLFLLDEATSALDNENAKQVEENILALPEITCVTVTHKLNKELLQKYDTIFVMEKGQIAEQGSYVELCAENGVFKRLCAAS